MEVSRRASGSKSRGSLIHPRSSLYLLVEVLRECGPGWVSSLLPGLWFSPREEPGSEATRSGRRENLESLSRSTGEVPLFGSKIDSATNLMGDVPVPLPPNSGPFFSGLQLYSLKMRGRERSTFAVFQWDSIFVPTRAVLL